jgi:hypothetical protein
LHIFSHPFIGRCFTPLPSIGCGNPMAAKTIATLDYRALPQQCLYLLRQTAPTSIVAADFRSCWSIWLLPPPNSIDILSQLRRKIPINRCHAYSYADDQISLFAPVAV